MTWNELIDAVADRAGLSKAATRRAIEALAETASDAIERHEPVRLKDVCTLRPVWRGPRVLRSLQDHRKMFIDGRWGLTVRPAKRMRDRLAAQGPQQWREADHQAAWRLAETLLGDLELYHAERVPSLNAEAGDNALREACATALGPAWRKAVKTWETDVPEGVRESRDHLAEAIRARWCARPAAAG